MPQPPTTHRYRLCFLGGPSPTYEKELTSTLSIQDLLVQISEAYESDRMLICANAAIAVRCFHCVSIEEIPQ